jgi:hypothetical protein
LCSPGAAWRDEPSPRTAWGQSVCDPAPPPCWHAQPSGTHSPALSDDPAHPKRRGSDPDDLGRQPIDREDPRPAGHRAARLRPRQSLRPLPRSQPPALPGRGWRRTTHQQRSSSHRSRPPRRPPDPPSHTTPAPGRTVQRSGLDDGAGTGQAWHDQHSDSPPAPDTPRPQPAAARSAARTARRCSRRRAALSQHHRRVIHRTTTAISAISGIEPSQIQLRDDIKDEERQMIFRQPVPHPTAASRTTDPDHPSARSQPQPIVRRKYRQKPRRHTIHATALNSATLRLTRSRACARRIDCRRMERRRCSVSVLSVVAVRPARNNSAGVDQLSTVLSVTRQLRGTAVGLACGHLRTVLRPTLDTGTQALVVATLAWLAR